MNKSRILPDAAFLSLKNEGNVIIAVHDNSAIREEKHIRPDGRK
ncbi:hypothetical protein [Paenibacillus riograndensis]|nr:hypothetical protein [Paenibacillus riograndensis]